MAYKVVKKIGDSDKKPVAEPPEQLTDEEMAEREASRQRLVVMKRLYNYAKESRRKHDWEWLVRTLYVKGYHFARYNRSTNTVTFATRTGVRIPINLTGAHLRAVRNQVTSFRPKWEVLPRVTTESAIENAKYSTKILDFFYTQLHIKRKIKELITHALQYSVGIWQFGIKGKNGDIDVTPIDPFDFYVDPNVRSSNLNDPEYGAEYVFKTVNRPVEAVKNDKRYSYTDSLQPDNKIASAEYKTFILQVTKNYFQQPTDSETVLLYEGMRREYQEDGSFKLRLMTWTENSLDPQQDKLLDETEYPYEVYQGEINPLELYGESWVKHLIPINRIIDALESHIFEYNHFYAKGRFVVDKNSGVRIIVNQHGQVIEKNRGSQVTSLPLQPLPMAPFEQLQNFRRYMEDLSGAHDVSLGRIPAGIRSGTGIAELKQADATNQDDLVDNLEDFLERSAYRILRLVADNWMTSKLITVTGLGGQPAYFMAVGERSKMLKKGEDAKFTFGSMELPLAVIGRENEVRVQVGSWLAYTKAARKEELKDLFRIGAIDQRTLLEHLEFGDVENILERARNERLLDLKAGRTAASVERLNPGVELSDEEIALAENELMTEGKDQKVEPDDDHEIHLAIHKEAMGNREFKDIVIAHMNEHLSQQRWMQNQLAKKQVMEAEQNRGPGRPDQTAKNFTPQPGEVNAPLPELTNPGAAPMAQAPMAEPPMSNVPMPPPVGGEGA